MDAAPDPVFLGGFPWQGVEYVRPTPVSVQWTDLGVTGYRVHGAGTTGASSGIMDSSFTAAHGTQERTCAR